MGAVYAWELRKLRAQKRTYLGIGGAMVVPVIFVVALALQKGGPNDVPLGRYIRETGLATPFVVLFFMSIWAFPLITALVAGDIVASETHNGTLKTILTRSRDRGAAVLLCSHLLAEVEENCSRVLILNRGLVVAEGTVAEIVRKAAAPPPRRADHRPRPRGHAGHA